MAKTQSPSQITVRGGVVNFPPTTKPRLPIRHQPDTPRTKKQTTVRPDHQIPDADPPTITPDEPPIVNDTPDPPAEETETD